MSFFVPTKFVWRFGGNQVGAGQGGRGAWGARERADAGWRVVSEARGWRRSPPPQVFLCGSFTRWVETVPMTPAEGHPGTFSVVVHLPPG